MKKLHAPIFDDNAALEALSLNEDLGSYPKLRFVLDNILDQYNNYGVNQGNPWLINPLGIPETLRKNLVQHYNHPPKNLPFIQTLREEGSPNVCPMCGSLGTGTLDHYLPKEHYPEFALLSNNLVPACLCNIKRKNVYKGDNNNKRPLHPYYDDSLQARLIRASISGTFLTPNIILITCCGPIAQIQAVEFHLETILSKTNVIKWLEASWVKLTQRPYAMLKNLPDGLVTEDHVRNSARRCLQDNDEAYETPNNWFSFLYSGILESNGVVSWLTNRVNGINSGAITIN